MVEGPSCVARIAGTTKGRSTNGDDQERGGVQSCALRCRTRRTTCTMARQLNRGLVLDLVRHRLTLLLPRAGKICGFFSRRRGVAKKSGFAEQNRDGCVAMRP